MSEVFTPVFTDVVKDIIGNDPVSDQFDTYYDASFYGTLQDSFITGTMVFDVTNASPFRVAGKVFSQGIRGKIFNKFDANSQPPLDDTYGSYDVNRVPNLSYRLVPWKERIARSFRISQCHDSQERYYDTCLPDLNNALSANGASPWKIFNNTNAGDDDADLWLSPYKNFPVSQDTAFLYFNGIKMDRTSQGLNDDPLVDNSWTWSYPYESRYVPEKRILDSKSVISQVSVATKFTSSAWPEYFEKLATKDRNLANLNNYSSPAAQPPFQTFYSLNRPESVARFIPLLPGKHASGLLSAVGRNSFKYPISIKRNEEEVYVPLTAYGDSNLDDAFGWSLLVPSDVKLNQQVSHNYLSSYSGITIPPDGLLTGSMTYADTIKFMFGFGDMNTMTYGKRNFIYQNSSSSYYEPFNYAPGTTVTSISDYTSDPSLEVRWSTPTGYTNSWRVLHRKGTASWPNEPLANYNYISGSVTSGILDYGLAWLETSKPGSGTILVSQTDPIYGGTFSDTGSTSFAVVDITSSYPWTFAYDRAVASHTSDGLFTFFSAYPGVDDISKLPLGTQNSTLPIEFVRGQALTGSNTLVKMTRFDLRTSVSSDTYPTSLPLYLLWGRTSGSKYEYPLPPGKWRLNFSYVKSGSAPNPPGEIAEQDIAAINNFEIFTWRESAFQPIDTIGGNNYPEFRSIKIDNRINPIADIVTGSLQTAGCTNIGNAGHMTNTLVTGSAETYSGHLFGISPVIRGWKYGLHSGLPTTTKAVFKRDHYGHFRDMLEQRQYTKFVQITSSPLDQEATVVGPTSIAKERDEAENVNVLNSRGVVGDPVVSVSFVRRRCEINDRGLGRIYNELVSPYLTTSQNLSIEVTSSLPYFDFVARHREESTMPTRDQLDPGIIKLTT